MSVASDGSKCSPWVGWWLMAASWGCAIECAVRGAAVIIFNPSYLHRKLHTWNTDIFVQASLHANVVYAVKLVLDSYVHYCVY